MPRTLRVLLLSSAAAVAVIGGVFQAAAAPPSCASLPAPFPCGTGTHQVCTKRVQCYGDKPGTVPQLTATCTQAKCVKDVAVKAPAAAQKKQLNPQPEPPGIVKSK